MEKLVIASSNKGKLKEIKAMLGSQYEIVPMSELGFCQDVEETGTTFFENALIKAKTVSQALGENVLADDSGLSVEALGGAPGVYSARYSGEHGNDAKNRALLLENLKGQSNRKAKFISSIVLYKKDGTYFVGHGETSGTILHAEEGNNGFGYDSLFKSDDLNLSFGLATDEEKNSVSHRFRALMDLQAKITQNH